MKIISVNIGERKDIQWKHKLISTGIFKYPVKTAIMLGQENVENDAVVDRKYHGGINKAVYAYNADYYEYWQKLYPELTLDFGMFGENLTISDFEEDQIHVGDVFKVGSAVIEATQPREPCYKLGIRFGHAKVVKQFWNDTKCGVYFKVLQVGAVKAGDLLECISQKAQQPTILEVYQKIKENIK